MRISDWSSDVCSSDLLAAAAERAPIVVSGPDCSYSPFAKQQDDACGRLLDYFSKKGIAYTTLKAPETVVTVGGVAVADPTPQALDAVLATNGYVLDPVVPAGRAIGRASGRESVGQ